MDDLTDITDDLEAISVSKSVLCDPEQSSRHVDKENNSLNVFHLNICSVNKHFNELVLLLHSADISCDFVILSESWLSKVGNLPTLQGYTSYQSTYANQNAGVCIFVRANLIHTVYQPSFLDANCLVCTSGEVAIIAIYRSPSFANTDNFLTSLNDTLISLRAYKTIAIIGDININILPDQLNAKSEEYLDICYSHGLLPAHLIPTRNDSCLDHVMLKTRRSATTLVWNTHITDHLPMLLSLNSKNIINKPKCFTQRTDQLAVITELKTYDFSVLYEIKDANHAAESFTSIVSDVIQRHTKQIKIPHRKKIIRPWITAGLLKCIKHRDSLHQRAKADPTNIVLQVTYKRYRNFCNNLLQKIKSAYDRTQFQNAKGNIRATWEVIKMITDTDRPNALPNELLSLHSTPKDSVNFINKYFVNVGKSLADKIQNNTCDNKSYKSFVAPDSNMLGNSMALPDITASELDTIIHSLKDKCAVGCDGISTFLLKSLHQHLNAPLKYIFNLALSTGTFPEAFKKALVQPVYKSGDRSHVVNYRPISILTTISKIFEKYINTKLIDYLNQFNIIAHNQYGFVKGKSTEDAVMDLTETVIKSFDKKLKALAIFLDLSKAFDTVSVPILLDRMEAIGIRGIVLDVFRSYLSGRSQCVRIGNYVSDEETISFGVPQGSVLGPTLFIIYINELCRLKIPNCKIVTYADDTALIVHGENWNIAYNNAERALSSVMSWLTANLLTLNIEKTGFVTFFPSAALLPQDGSTVKAHFCNPVGWDCSCPSLKQMSSIKYLGVHIDAYFRWNKQIESMTSRVRKLIYIVKKLRSSADGGTLKLVYYTLCQSIISYCVSVWGGACATNMLRLERAQRAVLKVLTGKPRRFSTTQLYKECSVMTVRQLFVFQTILRRHALLPYIPNNKRRKDRICVIEPHRTALAGRSFAINSCRLYNRINKIVYIYPLPLKECKVSLKRWLLTLDYHETENLFVILV